MVLAIREVMPRGLPCNSNWNGVRGADRYWEANPVALALILLEQIGTTSGLWARASDWKHGGQGRSCTALHLPSHPPLNRHSTRSQEVRRWFCILPI